MNLLHQFAVHAPDLLGILPMDGLDGWVPKEPPKGSDGIKKAFGVFIGWAAIIGTGVAIVFMLIGLGAAAADRDNRKSHIKGAVFALIIAVVLGALSTVLGIAETFITTILNQF